MGFLLSCQYHLLFFVSKYIFVGVSFAFPVTCFTDDRYGHKETSEPSVILLGQIPCSGGFKRGAQGRAPLLFFHKI